MLKPKSNLDIDIDIDFDHGSHTPRLLQMRQAIPKLPAGEVVMPPLDHVSDSASIF